MKLHIINIIDKLVNVLNIAESFAIAHKEMIVKVALIIVAVVAIVMIIKRLLTFSVRVLMGILAIAFLVIVTPKINTFLLNHFDQYDVLEQKISEQIDEDMSLRVKCQYRYDNGTELTDQTLLSQLKAEEYKIDPSLTDNMNVILNAGLPEGVNEVIRLNVGDFGDATIQADSFSDYMARYFILRVSEILSLLIAFTVASKIFVCEV